MDLIEELLVLAGVPLDETKRLDEMKEKDAGVDVSTEPRPSLADAVYDFVIMLTENPNAQKQFVRTKAKVLIKMGEHIELQEVCVLIGQYDKIKGNGKPILGFSVRHILSHILENEADMNYRDDNPSKATLMEICDALEAVELELKRRAEENRPFVIDGTQRNPSCGVTVKSNGRKFRASIGVASKSDEIPFLITIYPLGRVN